MMLESTLLVQYCWHLEKSCALNSRAVQRPAANLPARDDESPRICCSRLPECSKRMPLPLSMRQRPCLQEQETPLTKWKPVSMGLHEVRSCSASVNWTQVLMLIAGPGRKSARDWRPVRVGPYAISMHACNIPQHLCASFHASNMERWHCASRGSIEIYRNVPVVGRG